MTVFRVLEQQLEVGQRPGAARPRFGNRSAAVNVEVRAERDENAAHGNVAEQRDHKRRRQYEPNNTAVLFKAARFFAEKSVLFFQGRQLCRTSRLRIDHSVRSSLLVL